ncbi:hypothetical protein MRBBS_3517 [Marinobacter sp. BSs20148]|nr:hypothetical protein MRBBS_3517 [Marinobacter sp. BSs20148]
MSVSLFQNQKTPAGLPVGVFESGGSLGGLPGCLPRCSVMKI